MSDSVFPDNIKDGLRWLLGGVFVFVAGFEGYVMLFDGRIVAGSISIFIAIALTAVVVSWNRILHWRPALGPKMEVLVGDFRSWMVALSVLLLAIIVSPYVEEKRWPFSAWFAPVLTDADIVNAKTKQSDDDRKQISDAQDAARKTLAAKAVAEHNLDTANQQIATLQSQRDAANQKLSALQNPSAPTSAPPPAAAPTATFAQTYHLTEPQIKELRDEIFAVKGALPPSINIEMVQNDNKAIQLANQIYKAFDLAGANPVLSLGHPTSPHDVGILMRVGNLQAIPDGVKTLAATFKKVTGAEPTFIYSHDGLGPGGFSILVGPNPND